MAKEQNKKDQVVDGAKKQKTSSAKVIKSKQAKAASLKITQIKSPIGRKEYQKQTLIGLGLNKLNKVSLVEDTNAIRGMITKVNHLIKIEKL